MKDGIIGTFTVAENLLLIDHNSKTSATPV